MVLPRLGTGARGRRTLAAVGLSLAVVLVGCTEDNLGRSAGPTATTAGPAAASGATPQDQAGAVPPSTGPVAPPSTTTDTSPAAGAPGGGPAAATGPSTPAPEAGRPFNSPRDASQVDAAEGVPVATYATPPESPCASAAGDVVLEFTGSSVSARCVNASRSARLTVRNRSNVEVAFVFDAVTETLVPGQELTLGTVGELAGSGGSKQFWFSGYPDLTGRINIS